MSKFARHEVVMNGVNTEGKLQRTLVLDSNFSPRHVFKLNRHYAKRFERTSQLAYAGDFIIETTATYDEQGFTQINLDVFRLSGPCSVANGRPQLFRVAASEQTIRQVKEALLTDELASMLNFLMLDRNFDVIQSDPLNINAVLPTFVGWNGQVGITEEKQSAYIIDLLGGVPVHYVEDIAVFAMYSKRQYIMPFETYELPEQLNFHNNIVASPGFVPRPNCEINWVVYFNNGGVAIIENEEQAAEINMREVSTCIKLYLEPFADEEHGEYGLVVEVYSSNSTVTSALPGFVEEVEEA